MCHKNYLETLLARKDEEIASLESRLQTYIGRLSLLQNRLLSALDTLDVIQNNQTQALSASTQLQNHLQARLDHYTGVAKAAEIERDDMRDAVLKLVEKVETSNDYSKWPHSQIYISSLSEPCPTMHLQSSDEGELISYAAALIESLRRERDQELKAHAQTRDSAEARILALEAKLSRREAELELRIAGADHVVSVEPVPLGYSVADKDPITSDQIISMLDLTVARNKILENEITSLFRRLEDARAKSSSLSPSNNVSPTISNKNVFEPNSNASLDTKIPHHVSSTPTPLSDSNVADHLMSSDSTLTSEQSLLRDLDRQIRALGNKIDAFAEERRALLQAVHPEPFIESNSQHDRAVASRRIDILETECSRLRTSESRLHDELEVTKAVAHNRESELLEQINSLKSALGNLPKMAETVFDFLSPDDGEMSMELATPLLPLNTIPEHNETKLSLSSLPAFYSPYVEPSSIPLPPSPESDSDDIGSPTLSLSQMMLGGSERTLRYQATSCFVAELRQVENELAATAMQLQEGERALDQVANLVHELHPP